MKQSEIKELMNHENSGRAIIQALILGGNPNATFDDNLVDDFIGGHIAIGKDGDVTTISGNKKTITFRELG